MVSRSEKIIIASFGTMAALTAVHYFIYQGPGSYFDSSWIWYASLRNNLTLVIDFFILLALFSVAVFGFWSFVGNQKFNLFIFLLLLIFSVFTKPLGSADMSFYYSQGKVAAENRNTFVVNWKKIPFGDKSIKYFDEDQKSYPYGPITLTISHLFYDLSRGNMVVFAFLAKIFNLLGAVCCAVLVGFIRRMLGRAVVLQDEIYNYIISPFILFEVGVNGHLDPWFVVFVLLAILAAVKNLWQYVLPLLIIGIWIKYLPIIFLPIFLFWFLNRVTKNNLPKMLWITIVGIFLATSITFASWYPYWQGPEVFSGITKQFSIVNLSPSINTPVYILEKLLSTGPELIRNFGLQILAIFRIIIFAFVVYLAFPIAKNTILKVSKRERVEDVYFIKALYLASLLYLYLVQKTFWPWYLILPFFIGWILIGIEKSPWISLVQKYFYAPLLIYYLINFILDVLYFRYLTNYGLGYLSVFMLRESISLIYALVCIFPLYYIIRWRKNNYEYKSAP